MATNDSAIACDNANQDFWELIAGAIGVMADGKKYLRTHKITPVPGSNGIGCNSGINSKLDLENELKNLFCLDANGDIAIRISQTT